MSYTKSDEGNFGGRAVPYREKSCWASLIAVTCAYGIYFAILVPRLGAGRPDHVSYIPLLIACVLGLVVLEIAMQAGLAVLMRQETRQPKDERERLIGLKSDRIAMVVMAASLGCAWWLSIVSPAFTTATAIWANLLLFGLVLSAIAKYFSAIVYYHRSV